MTTLAFWRRSLSAPSPRPSTPAGARRDAAGVSGATAPGRSEDTRAEHGRASGGGVPTAPAPLAPPNADAVAFARTPSGDLLGRLGQGVGALLRRWSVTVGDTEQRLGVEVQRTAELWAQHLAEGAPAPGTRRAAPGGEGAHAGDAGAPAPTERVSVLERDWQGALTYLGREAEIEAAHREAAMATLRDTIMTLTQQLYAGYVEDAGEGQETASQVTRLRESLQSRSLDDVKREVYGTVQLLTRLAEERRVRRDRQVNELSGRLRQIRDELESAQRAATLDEVTGVLNRAGLERMLTQTAQMHVITGQRATILMLDLDRFKAVNDTLGHATGDRLLRQVATLLVRTFVRKGDIVGRYGGDEFVVILPETSEADAVRVADRLLDAAAREEWGIGALTIGLSVGVAELERVETGKRWLERADHALLRAKREGRGRVSSTPFSPDQPVAPR